MQTADLGFSQGMQSPKAVSSWYALCIVVWSQTGCGVEAQGLDSTMNLKRIRPKNQETAACCQVP